jgi:hypothetical protein
MSMDDQHIELAYSAVHFETRSRRGYKIVGRESLSSLCCMRLTTAWGIHDGATPNTIGPFSTAPFRTLEEPRDVCV